MFCGSQPVYHAPFTMSEGYLFFAKRFVKKCLLFFRRVSHICFCIADAPACTSLDVHGVAAADVHEPGVSKVCQSVPESEPAVLGGPASVTAGFKRKTPMRASDLRSLPACTYKRRCQITGADSVSASFQSEGLYTSLPVDSSQSPSAGVCGFLLMASS